MQDSVSFWRLPSGRLFALGCGISLLDVSVTATMTTSSSDTLLGVSSVILMFGIAACITSVGLALTEAPGSAAYVAMVGPVLMFAFYALYGYASDASMIGLLYPFMAAGALCILVALRPGVTAS